MIVNGKHYTSIWRNEKKQDFIIDQRNLPHEFKIVELKKLLSDAKTSSLFSKFCCPL